MYSPVVDQWFAHVLRCLEVVYCSGLNMLVPDYLNMLKMFCSSYPFTCYGLASFFINNADFINTDILCIRDNGIQSAMYFVFFNFLDRDENFSQESLNHHLEVMEELVRRDKNRPSAIIWSVANEPNSANPLADHYFG